MAKPGIDHVSVRVEGWAEVFSDNPIIEDAFDVSKGRVVEDVPEGLEVGEIDLNRGGIDQRGGTILGDHNFVEQVEYGVDEPLVLVSLN